MGESPSSEGYSFAQADEDFCACGLQPFRIDLAGRTLKTSWRCRPLCLIRFRLIRFLDGHESRIVEAGRFVVGRCRFRMEIMDYVRPGMEKGKGRSFFTSTFRRLSAGPLFDMIYGQCKG